MPEQTKTEHFLQSLGNALGVSFKTYMPGHDISFVLLVFEDIEPKGSRVNYVSNISRESAIVALKEVLERWEKLDA